MEPFIPVWGTEIQRLVNPNQAPEYVPLENIQYCELTVEEEEQLRRETRENYKPGEFVSLHWHPIVRDECRLINGEEEP